jgi:anti-sigma B factor antagonist
MFATEIRPFAAELAVEPEHVTLHLKGEIDLFSSPALSGALAKAAAADRPVVRIDLRALTFIDSTGISALLRATDTGRSAGRVVQFVRSDDGTVERTLRIAGVDRLLPLAA